MFQTYVSRQNISNLSFQNTEGVWFTGEINFLQEGQEKAGYSAVTSKQVTGTKRFALGTSVSLYVAIFLCHNLERRGLLTNK